MNLKEKFKRNKGITLIALVVTLVVLLILAGISIMMLTGQNGILTRANQAKENMGTAQTEELVKLSVTDALTQGLGSLTDENLKSSLNNNIGAGKYTITGDATNGWTVTVNEKKFKVNSTGNVANFGGWKANDTNTEFTKDGKTLKIGDYVNYSCTDGVDTTEEVEEKTIYTSTSDKNGYSDQKFKLTDYTGKWKVLGVDEEECLQLISSDIIAPNGASYYYLSRQNGYVNGVSELDKISSLYGQGKYAKSARSVNVEDVNKITGYKDDNYYAGTSSVHQTGNEVTYTLNADGKVHTQGTKYPTSDTTTSSTSFTYWTGAEWKSLASGESATIKHNYYYYYPQTLTIDDSKKSETKIKNLDGEASTNAYNLLFANTSSKNYWLGSQFSEVDWGSVSFGLRFVSNGYVRGYDVYTSKGGTGTVARGVRPAVSLKSEIQITGGDGSTSTPCKW